MSGASFFPSMGNISNRKFIERMEMWGWTVKKIRGETTLLVSPNDDKVEVRSAHIRQGNPPKTFQEVLSIMGLTWEDFIRPMDAETQLAMKQYLALDDDEKRLIWQAAEVKFMTDTERVKAQQRAQELRKRDERRMAARAERDRRVTNPHPTPIDDSKPRFVEPETPKTEEKPMEPEAVPEAATPKAEEQVTLSHLKPGQVPSVKQVKSRVRSRGLTNRTLDVLVATNEPVSIERLTRLMPDVRRDAIQQACLSLVRWNVAERVKPGVYRVREEARRNGDVRVDIVARAASAEPAPAAPPAPVPPVAPGKDTSAATTATAPQEPAEAPDAVRTADVGVMQKTYPAVRSGDQSELDEMVNETLDLLFPQGFKARHLPLIDQWRQATIALMREINNG